MLDRLDINRTSDRSRTADFPFCIKTVKIFLSCVDLYFCHSAVYTTSVPQTFRVRHSSRPSLGRISYTQTPKPPQSHSRSQNTLQLRSTASELSGQLLLTSFLSCSSRLWPLLGRWPTGSPPNINNIIYKNNTFSTSIHTHQRFCAQPLIAVSRDKVAKKLLLNERAHSQFTHFKQF